MKKVLVILVALGLLVAMALPGCKAAAPEVFEWRVETPGYPGSMETGWTALLEEFIERESGGRLQIDWFYAGEIVPEEEILSATGKGILELSTTTGGYEIGKYPELDLAGGIPGINRLPYEDMMKLNNESKFFDFVSETLAQENCLYLGWYWMGPYPVLATTKPIRTLEDFKGLKVRAYGMFAELYAKLGASTTYIPGSELYMALKLGTLDCVTYTIDGIVGLKWYEIMDYWIRPEPGQLGNMWFVNQDSWNELPQDLKDVVRRSIVYFQGVAQEGINKLIEQNYALAEEGWYEIVDLPDEDVDKLNRLIEETTWTEFAAKSPRCAEGIELMREWYGE